MADFRALTVQTGITTQIQAGQNLIVGDGVTTTAGDLHLGAATGKVVVSGGTVGPTTGQQHTIPAVASDTYTLNAATQTLTGKTLTAPKMTGLNAGDLLVGAGFSTISTLAIVAAGAVLISGASPAWSRTPTLDGLTLTQPAGSGVTPASVMTVTGGAHTTGTAGVEFVDISWALNRTVQHATGAITTQRAIVIQPPTYSFVGASTITNAATLAITNAPVAGTNATITNRYSIWCQAGVARFQGGVTTGDPSVGSEFFGIGASAGNFGTALGGGAAANGGGVGAAIAIGASSSATGERSMAFGVLASATLAGQIVFTVNDSAINSTVYFGNGVTATTPSKTRINATGGSGTNVVGAELGFAAGISTGNGNGANVVIYGTEPGLSGAGAQTLRSNTTFSQRGRQTNRAGFGTTGNHAAVDGVIYADMSQTQNAAGAGEKDLKTFTLPANYISATNDSLEITVWGQFAANGNQKRVRLYFGTAIFDTTLLSFTGGQWKIKAIVGQRGASSQTSSSTWIPSIDQAGVLATQEVGTTSAQNETGAITIKVTADSGAAAAGDIKQDGMLIRLCPQQA